MASRGVGETQGKFATVEQVAKFKLRVEAQSRRTNRLF